MPSTSFVKKDAKIDAIGDKIQDIFANTACKDFLKFNHNFCTIIWKRKRLFSVFGNRTSGNGNHALMLFKYKPLT